MIKKNALVFMLLRMALCGLFVLYAANVGADNRPIIVLNTTGQPPLNTPDQKGFMDRVALEAFSRIGIKLVTVHLPAERGLLDANAGHEDGEMSRIAGLGDKYPNLVQVPEKIMDWEFSAFSKRMQQLNPGWAGLETLSVAIITGWKILENKVPATANLTKVKASYQLFHLLEQDRVDLVLYERWGGLAMLKHHKTIKLLEPPLAVKAMYIYLHKKHQKIIPLLAQSLREIKQDGTYDKIYHQVLAPMDHQ